MKKYLFIVIILFISFIRPVYAVCPVCTVAVGAGLGLSRWIGIDDTVSGVWIGGLIFSSGLWLADWIKNKKWKIPGVELFSVLLMFLFVIPPLYLAKIIGHPDNVFRGIDKLVLGTTFGSVGFVLGVFIDKLLRQSHQGKVYFPYQKVIIPVSILLMISIFFYIITK